MLYTGFLSGDYKDARVHVSSPKCRVPLTPGQGDWMRGLQPPQALKAGLELPHSLFLVQIARFFLSHSFRFFFFFFSDFLQVLSSTPLLVLFAWLQKYSFGGSVFSCFGLLPYLQQETTARVG